MTLERELEAARDAAARARPAGRAGGGRDGGRAWRGTRLSGRLASGGRSATWPLDGARAPSTTAALVRGRDRDAGAGRARRGGVGRRPADGWSALRRGPAGPSAGGDEPAAAAGGASAAGWRLASAASGPRVATPVYLDRIAAAAGGGGGGRLHRAAAELLSGRSREIRSPEAESAWRALARRRRRRTDRVLPGHDLGHRRHRGARRRRARAAPRRMMRRGRAHRRPADRQRRFRPYRVRWYATSPTATWPARRWRMRCRRWHR